MRNGHDFFIRNRLFGGFGFLGVVFIDFRSFWGSGWPALMVIAGSWHIVIYCCDLVRSEVIVMLCHALTVYS